VNTSEKQRGFALLEGNGASITQTRAQRRKRRRGTENCHVQNCGDRVSMASTATLESESCGISARIRRKHWWHLNGSPS
jgi:hypothetical protein